jgi:hypothetical protein
LRRQAAQFSRPLRRRLPRRHAVAVSIVNHTFGLNAMPSPTLSPAPPSASTSPAVSPPSSPTPSSFPTLSHRHFEGQCPFVLATRTIVPRLEPRRQAEASLVRDRVLRLVRHRSPPSEVPECHLPPPAMKPRQAATPRPAQSM